MSFFESNEPNDPVPFFFYLGIVIGASIVGVAWIAAKVFL